MDDVCSDLEGEERINKIEELIERDIHQAMQGIVYNLNTMHSRAGSQVPFSSINIGLPGYQNRDDGKAPEYDESIGKDAALITRIFLEEFEKGMGKNTPTIFPNVIFVCKQGVNVDKEDRFYYLFKLACRVASKRMNPTFLNVDNSYFKEYWDKGAIPQCMGCRTNIMSDINGKPATEGRGNAANVSINLPRIGILADKDTNKLFKLLDERIELSKDKLIHRKSICSKMKVNDIPFIAGQKLYLGSENLKDTDTIEEILKHCTWGIGFVGLEECIYAVLGKSRKESLEARELGLKIVSHIREMCDKYTEEYKMNFSCYATPAETIIYKFCQSDRKRFGIIEGVTNKDYYTNSFHIPVSQTISIKEKLLIESPYHSYCNGGSISYIEIDDYPDPELLEEIVHWTITETDVRYIGINFHIRYCKDCGRYLHDENVCECGSHDIQGISRVK